MNPTQSRILIVDDTELVREMLTDRLEYQGYGVDSVEDGFTALDRLQEESFDLILLDIMMPGMNGFQVLERLKADAKLRDIPVIVISAMDDRDSIVQGISMGADDYLSKPIDNLLLKARISSCLLRKQWRDQEKEYLEQIEKEREKSERLLLNVLPHSIAERLKQHEGIIADHFESATVLFADIVGFTPYASVIPPVDMVDTLNHIFSTFDQLAEKHGLEKIKTMGDAYMAVGGIPIRSDNHVQAVANMALDMQEFANNTLGLDGNTLKIRIGINTGPVVAGIIGQKKFSYDLWGDTVNVASRMESSGQPGLVQITKETYGLLKDDYECEERGMIFIKGKGEMMTYFLRGKLPEIIDVEPVVQPREVHGSPNGKVSHEFFTPEPVSYTPELTTSIPASLPNKFVTTNASFAV
ncbi:MAG: adenylate/guanylate cyclase domain-containing protein [Chloroflexota bacterium]